ncbi:hypothetical protein ACQVTS_31900 [Bacillus mycoides]|uniref:hypothetical protein n=1 Tax=Bacillus mycoides TaxID=1405 RepID=UPI003D6543B7
MSKLCVTTKYGLTAHDLLQEERKMKATFFNSVLWQFVLSWKNTRLYPPLKL